MIRLQEIREERKLTQKKLSLISGVPQQTISAIEAGVRKNPGILTLRCLATALECSVDDMVQTDDNELPEAADNKEV